VQETQLSSMDFTRINEHLDEPNSGRQLSGFAP
jgi:hypothetical protein